MLCSGRSEVMWNVEGEKLSTDLGLDSDRWRVREGGVLRGYRAWRRKVRPGEGGEGRGGGSGGSGGRMGPRAGLGGR